MPTQPPSRRAALAWAGVGLGTALGLAGCLGRGEPEGRVEVTGASPAGRRQVYQQLVERLIAPIDQLWGQGSLPYPVKVLAPATSADWSDLSGLPGDQNTVPAVVTGEGQERVIVMNPAAYDILDAQGKHLVLAHEMTHLAQSQQTDVPWWLREGSAEFTAYEQIDGGYPARWPDVWRETAALVAAEPALPAQPRIGTGLSTANPDRLTAYASAWSVCAWMAQRSDGPDVVPRVYSAIAEGQTMDEVARREWEMSGAEMIEAWSAWLAEQASINN
ncbi:DUF1570 domain-containing protein [Ornithinimicrobium sp. Arc0846-15]|nr:DUF1570 domain-containing protein [Ornithinimicrobium laminariae]